jgi:hypothetical protein
MKHIRFVTLLILFVLVACQRADPYASDSDQEPTATAKPNGSEVLDTQEPQDALIEPTIPGDENNSSAPEATAIITTTAIPKEVLSTTPTSTYANAARFYDLHFNLSGNPSSPQIVFPVGTEEVFAIWNYANLSPEDVIRRVWMKNGVEWLVREESWDSALYGSDGVVNDVSVYDFEGSGLESGLYHLTIYINEVHQAEALFEIHVATDARLSASSGTQFAWVQAGHMLMLDTQAAAPRELTQANEIVELRWLPDGQHLLYVDQQQTDQGGPPWPRHLLWLVDTATGEQWQLSSVEQNLHRLGPVNNRQFIRTLSGSDYSDACVMDRQLVFVELDENYQLVALHRQQDFDSVLASKTYWFFPADVGKWVSDHEYEVNLDAYCLVPGMTESEEDLALPGRYRFNLETMTAVKVSD